MTPQITELTNLTDIWQLPLAVGLLASLWGYFSGQKVYLNQAAWFAIAGGTYARLSGSATVMQTYTVALFGLVIIGFAPQIVGRLLTVFR